MSEKDIALEIESIAKDHEIVLLTLKKRKESLYAHALDFSSYAEIYSFVKRHSKTQEEFNLAMWDIREKYLDKF